jgi:hypothetical protein
MKNLPQCVSKLERFDIDIICCFFAFLICGGNVSACLVPVVITYQFEHELRKRIDLDCRLP